MSTLSKSSYSKMHEAIRTLATRRVRIDCDRIPYQFDNVPIRKILNWIRVEASVYAKPSRPWGWPTHLQLEPTNRCNLRCALCPVSEGMNRPGGQMPSSVFKKVIDEVGDYLLLILLWDWGEPFLNPHVYEMIHYATQRGIKIVSSTNGHIFARDRQAEMVVKSGLDSLIFAVDGITQETYQRYRRGGELGTVLEGIRAVVTQRRRLGSSTPFLNLRFIVMDHNEHEVPKLKDLARSLGVDALSLKTVNSFHQQNRSGNGDAAATDHPTFIPGAPEYRRFPPDPTTRARIRVQHNPCKSLWNCPTIHWNGTVCPCTYDFNETRILGDLSVSSFAEIWSGIPYQQVRREFRMGWESIPMCHDCSYAYKGGNCITETVAHATFLGSRQHV